MAPTVSTHQQTVVKHVYSWVTCLLEGLLPAAPVPGVWQQRHPDLWRSTEVTGQPGTGRGQRPGDQTRCGDAFFSQSGSYSPTFKRRPSSSSSSAIINSVRVCRVVTESSQQHFWVLINFRGQKDVSETERGQILANKKVLNKFKVSC